MIIKEYNMLLKISKIFLIIMFFGAIGVSIFIMVDNYNIVVQENIHISRICDTVRTFDIDNNTVETNEVCYHYNPQFLFYSQIVIIPILLLIFVYIYKLLTRYGVRMGIRNPK